MIFQGILGPSKIKSVVEEEAGGRNSLFQSE